MILQYPLRWKLNMLASKERCQELQHVLQGLQGLRWCTQSWESTHWSPTQTTWYYVREADICGLLIKRVQVEFLSSGGPQWGDLHTGWAVFLEFLGHVQFISLFLPIIGQTKTQTWRPHWDFSNWLWTLGHLRRRWLCGPPGSPK